MAETEKQAGDDRAAKEGEKSREKSGFMSGWFKMSTVVSLITTVLVLIAVYLAIKYLAGSDYNLDALLTGQKATQLPKLP